MKRHYEFTETGEFPKIVVPPEHRSRKEPGATVDTLSTLIVEPVSPTWRDLWAILWRRYRPRLRVRLTAGVAVYDFILAKTYTTEALEKALYRDKPFLGEITE